MRIGSSGLPKPGMIYALAMALMIFFGQIQTVVADGSDRPDDGVSGVIALLRIPAYLLPVQHPDAELPEKKGFYATFLVVNHSGEDIQFSLASLCGESKWMQFVLRNELEQVVWRSLPPLLCPIFLEEKILAAGTRIVERVWVPLAMDGNRLAAGRYELEAFIDGEPRYSAVAPFELVDAN